MTGVEKQKINLVTVCYWQELRLLALQARSIRMFVDITVIDRIILVINDRDYKKVKREIEASVLPEYGALADVVSIMPYKALTSFKFKRLGWRSQQLLKLLAAEYVKTETYMALDCKNHFIRPLKADCIWSNGGKLLMPNNKIISNFRPDYERACAFFGVKPLMLSESALPSVTPFLFYTSQVRGMVSYLETQEKKGFSEIFMKGPRLTEFYLYLAYLQKVCGGVDALYEVSIRRTICLMSSQKDDVPEAKKRISQAQQEHIYCFGVHRGLIETSNQDIREATMFLWQRMGLVSTLGEAHHFWVLLQQKPIWSFISLVMKWQR